VVVVRFWRAEVLHGEDSSGMAGLGVVW